MLKRPTQLGYHTIVRLVGSQILTVISHITFKCHLILFYERLLRKTSDIRLGEIKKNTFNEKSEQTFAI